MTARNSRLSGLRFDRDGEVTPKNLKAHLADLQSHIADLQEEIRTLTGGGRSQVPGAKTKDKTPFKLTTAKQGTAPANVQVQGALRTGTKSRTAHDHVTRAELQQTVGQSAGASGFMDLLTDQIVVSGNKDFGSMSFQTELYTIGVSDSLVSANLAGSTVWSLYPSDASATPGPVIRGIEVPSSFQGAFRILIWHGVNSALRLAHLSTAAGVVSTRRIHTMSLTTADTLASPQLISTAGPGVFFLYYDITAFQWIVIARTA